MTNGLMMFVGPNGWIRRPDYKTQIFCFYNKTIYTLSQGGKKIFLGFWGVIVKLLMFWKIFIGVLEKSCKDWFLFCVRYLRQSGISDFLLKSRKSLSRPCGDFNNFIDVFDNLYRTLFKNL